MRIDMKQWSIGGVLAGALNGRSVMSHLLALAASEPAQPEAVFLDYLGIDVATSSHIRESVLGFRDVIRGRDSLYYPVIANPNELVRDELLELTRARGDVVMTCALADDGTVSKTAIIGELEAKQLLTFKLVQQHGETDAGELMREYGKQENVQHTTAWNNRLAALVSLGLLVEMRQGRLKRYRPLFHGV